MKTHRPCILQPKCICSDHSHSPYRLHFSCCPYIQTLRHKLKALRSETKRAYFLILPFIIAQSFSFFFQAMIVCVSVIHLFINQVPLIIKKYYMFYPYLPVCMLILGLSINCKYFKNKAVFHVSSFFLDSPAKYLAHSRCSMTAMIRADLHTVLPDLICKCMFWTVGIHLFKTYTKQMNFYRTSFSERETSFQLMPQAPSQKYLLNVH